MRATASTPPKGWPPFGIGGKKGDMGPPRANAPNALRL